MFQSRRKRRREDDSRDDSPQVAGETKRRGQHPNMTLKRGLSTVEEEDDEIPDSLDVKGPSRAMKKAQEIAAFEATVQADKDRLRQHLHDRVRDVGKAEAQFKSQIKTYLTSFGVPVSKATGVHPQDEFHKILAMASRLVEASRQIDKDYHSLIAIAENVKKEIKKEDDENTWEEDKKEVAQLLEKGMKLSMKRIDQLILKEGKAGKIVGSIDVSSDLSYNKASRYFSNTHPQERRIRDILAQSTKSVRKVVRFLPEQEDN